MGEAVLVYDDDCGFCTWWADFFGARADIRIVGFTDVDEALRERLPEEYEDCSHVITDTAVYSCGSSFEAAFVRTSIGGWARPIVDFLRHFEDYERLRERCYRWIADRRDMWGKVISKTPPARRPAGNES